VFPADGVDLVRPCRGFGFSSRSGRYLDPLAHFAWTILRYVPPRTPLSPCFVVFVSSFVIGLLQSSNPTAPTPRRCIHCSVPYHALCSLSVGVPSGSDLHGVGSGLAIPSTDVGYGVVLYLGIASSMRYLLLSTYVCSVLAECGCPFGK